MHPVGTEKGNIFARTVTVNRNSFENMLNKATRESHLMANAIETFKSNINIQDTIVPCYFGQWDAT